jgi:hypothetical protein
MFDENDIDEIAIPTAFASESIALHAATVPLGHHLAGHEFIIPAAAIKTFVITAHEAILKRDASGTNCSRTAREIDSVPVDRN